MTIEAYLEASEDETVEELQELTPAAYKGIADSLSINQAEQAIIDEVAGVDGDDEEQEKEELENEREMKTLFESLYEIDPDTKEVFVKHAECCVDKLRARTANIPPNALTKDLRMKSAAELSALITTVKWAKEKGDFNVAQTKLSFINLQCQNCCG